MTMNMLDHITVYDMQKFIYVYYTEQTFPNIRCFHFIFQYKIKVIFKQIKGDKIDYSKILICIITQLGKTYLYIVVINLISTREYT